MQHRSQRPAPEGHYWACNDEPGQPQPDILFPKQPPRWPTAVPYTGDYSISMQSVWGSVGYSDLSSMGSFKQQVSKYVDFYSAPFQAQRTGHRLNPVTIQSEALTQLS